MLARAQHGSSLQEMAQLACALRRILKVVHTTICLFYILLFNFKKVDLLVGKAFL
jgi:hypothetical protein